MINIKKMNQPIDNVTRIVEPQISGIFPIPIYVSYMDRPFTSMELEVLNKAQNSLVPNAGNMTSADNYVLNKPELEGIRNILTAHTNEFIKRIYLRVNSPNHYIPSITRIVEI